MARINVLDKHTAELIAAGEVVERPSAVIKELVENSIDAGADVVTVEIRNGGITFMRVTDNGCGIVQADVPKAFLRHATSKIATKDDLDAILTLGFRGEALASISAVSRLELLTKSPEEETGCKYMIEGGEAHSLEEAGCPDGTTMIIRDLFYNTPARMKFMKKDATEGNAVAGVLDKIALSHPEVSVRFIRDGKEQLRTPGNGELKDAIYAVYGKAFSDGLIPVDYEHSGIRVTGYISLPSASRPNRSMQSFFINNRYIKSRTAGVALDEAYKGSVMAGRFGACILNLEMPAGLVDVNVHPAKLEVRFVDERPVFGAVYHAVKTALGEKDRPKALTLERSSGKRMDGGVGNNGVPEKKTDLKEQQSVQGRWTMPEQTGENEKTEQTALLDEAVYRGGSGRVVASDSEPMMSVPVLRKVMPSRMIDTIKHAIPRKEPKPEEINPQETETMQMQDVPEASVRNELEGLSLSDGYTYLGEAFDTYIIVQVGNDELQMIDKHAAHERILYEKLKKAHKQRDAQMLLEPVMVTLEKGEYSAVLEHLALLAEAGFEVEDFGPGVVVVRSMPMLLQGSEISDALLEIAGYLADNRREIVTEKLDFVFHNVACRAAMKGGDKRRPEELIAIARQLQEDPQLRYCPHGRPVSIMLSRKDLEKQFGRIQ